MMPLYWPRSSKGTRSQTMISPSVMIPPPPTPWTARAAISMAVLVAPPAKPDPSMKTRTEMMVKDRRPNMLAIWPKIGIVTVVARMYALATQTYRSPE